MVDLEYYKNLWGGDKVEGITIPDVYIFFGFPMKVGDKEKFLTRFGTVEGIQQQYKEFCQTAGIIYHLKPDGIS